MTGRGLRRTIVLWASAVAAVSCGGAAEKVRVEGVQNFDRHGWVGADLTLTVENASAHRVSVPEARITFYFEGVVVGEAWLTKRVEMPRRSRTQVPTRWKFRVPDPAAAYLLSRRIEEHRYEDIVLDVEAKVRIGWAGRRFSGQGLPLSDFIRIFETQEQQ